MLLRDWKKLEIYVASLTASLLANLQFFQFESDDVSRFWDISFKSLEKQKAFGRD